MSDYIFDPTQVAPDAGADPVPADTYDVQIDSCEVKELPEGKGERLSIGFAIVAGPYTGRKVFNNYNLWHKVSADTVRIAQGQLSALCHVTGYLKPLSKANQMRELIGGRCKITVSNDGTNNNVKAVMDVNGNKPQKAGSGYAPATTAPVAVATPGAQPAGVTTGSGWGAPAAAAPATAAASAPAAPAPAAPAPAAPAFPPAGWVVHPTSPGWYWNQTTNEVVSEADLRAKSAPPAAPAAPTTPAAPAAAPAAGWNQATSGAPAPAGNGPANPWGAPAA